MSVANLCLAQGEYVGSVVPMGSRRSIVDIPAPFTPRFKTRLERSVTQALVNPTRALPTLRRAIITATTELRLNSFTDDQIHALLLQLVEDVARSHSLDSTSIVSGHARWEELAARVVTWTRLA